MTEGQAPPTAAQSMSSGYAIRENQYYDSVFLMGVNSRLSKTPGVRQTAVLMGSEKNKALLADMGIRGGAIDAAGANDLVIAVVARRRAGRSRLRWMASIRAGRGRGHHDLLAGPHAAGRPCDFCQTRTWPS